MTIELFELTGIEDRRFSPYCRREGMLDLYDGPARSVTACPA